MIVKASAYTSKGSKGYLVLPSQRKRKERKGKEHPYYSTLTRTYIQFLKGRVSIPAKPIAGSAIPLYTSYHTPHNFIVPYSFSSGIIESHPKTINYDPVPAGPVSSPSPPSPLHSRSPLFPYDAVYSLSHYKPKRQSRGVRSGEPTESHSSGYNMSSPGRVRCKAHCTWIVGVLG